MTSAVIGLILFGLCMVAVVVVIATSNLSRSNSDGNAHMDEVRIEIMKKLAENIKEATNQMRESE